MRFKLLASAIAIFFLMPIVPVFAAPSISQVQAQVDSLREEAATKFEAANAVKYQISKLQQQLNSLQQGEAAAAAKTNKLQSDISKLAVENYNSGGLSNGLELMFSRDPAGYLSDAGTLEVLASRYSTKLRRLKTYKQGLQASQLVVSDKTSQLKAAQANLERQVADANASLARAEKLLSSLKADERKRLASLDDAAQAKILADSKKYAAMFAGGSTRGAIALRFALRQLGDIYWWGGAGPTRWDCSGLTMRAFGAAGVSLPHSAAVQYNYGKNVPRSAIAPGDLLFFGRPISHVAIYLGHGKMVQAPRPGKRVEVADFTGSLGRKPFVGAKRI